MELYPQRSSRLNSRLTGDYLQQSRVLWIRQTDHPDLQDRRDPLVKNLSDEMRLQGLLLELVHLQDMNTRRLIGVDLVLFDAFENFEEAVQKAIVEIRLHSRVPLVLLTSDYTSDQLIDALRSGVDAIWSSQTPSDLLLARCKALLRRWRLSAQ